MTFNQFKKSNYNPDTDHIKSSRNQQTFDLKVKVNFDNGHVSLSVPQLVTPSLPQNNNTIYQNLLYNHTPNNLNNLNSSQGVTYGNNMSSPATNRYPMTAQYIHQDPNPQYNFVDQYKKSTSTQ